MGNEPLPSTNWRGEAGLLLRRQRYHRVNDDKDKERRHKDNLLPAGLSEAVAPCDWEIAFARSEGRSH